jgi:uncharacterized RDD family membrane protein YckC
VNKLTSKRISIRGAEDVVLSYALAGPGSRIAAGLIDLTVIWLLIAIGFGLLLSAGMLAFTLSDLILRRTFAPATVASLITVVSLAFFSNIFYFIFLEWVTKGQSIGKRLMGLRVIHDGGQALNISASITRNLGRVIDFLPGPYLVGFVSVLISAKGQRIGDIMAGTVVIRHEAYVTPKLAMPKRLFPGQKHSTLSEALYQFERADLAQLGQEAFQILNEFYRRSAQLEAGQCKALERQIQEDMCLRLSGKYELDDGQVFLSELYLALREFLEA